jgi:hypothetical protein
MLRAADERAHEPGEDPWWRDTWHLDVATADGIGLSVRLACAPVLGVAWWWTHVLLPDQPGPVVVRDHEVPLPRQGLAVRADGLWGELDCETPFEHWTYGLEAFGVKLDDPADSLRGEIGERIPVGLDIEWDVDDAIDRHEFDRAGEHGYEQFGVVRGEILLARERIVIDAVGLRSHAWGAPTFERATRASWFRSDAGAFFESDNCEPLDTEASGVVMIPIEARNGTSMVLTRELLRSSRPDATVIGWSSRLDPANNVM